MKKNILIMVCLFLSFLALQSSDINAETKSTNPTLRFQLQGSTLTVSGTGDLDSLGKYTWVFESDENYKIRKLVIQEGITSISSRACISDMLYLEEIIFPESLIEIEGGACGAYYLKKVKFGTKLKKIGNHAFGGCKYLEQLTLPDSVEEIGFGAFECQRLKKLVLPASLKSWDKATVKFCPALRKVVNRSNISCELPKGYKKYVTWEVDGKKTWKIPAKKTAKAIKKKLPIKLHMRGGTTEEKISAYYRFGEEVKLPKKMKRKGYRFVGWCDNDGYTYDVTTIEPGTKKAVYHAAWLKYKITSKKTGIVEVSYDSREVRLGFISHAIRCSTNKNMKNASYFVSKKRKDKIKIRLEPGRTYYIDFGGEIIDNDFGFDEWRCKTKVSVCG